MNMTREYKTMAGAVMGVALLAGSQLVAAMPAAAGTLFDLTTSGPGSLVHSFSMTEDGITATVSAWAVEKNAGANEAVASSKLKNYGGWGTGICGPGDDNCDNPNHAADNAGTHRDLFLIEFSQAVRLDQATITEWGDAGPQNVSDSDVSFWAGTGSAGLTDGAIFDPAVERHDDEIFSGTLVDGQSREVDLTPAGGAVDWLMIGAVFDDADTYRDYFKLQSLEVSAVPVPAAAWLFGSGLLGLAGIARRRTLRQ
ncbi:MAG TPA: VPLPA-CTERM sorting domain-containing protein [Sedimenticola sp.]|nr:VPLPA-CTERM sorting domain-containing protein [Sedimenticola sp.]